MYKHRSEAELNMVIITEGAGIKCELKESTTYRLPRCTLWTSWSRKKETYLPKFMDPSGPA